MTQHVRTSYRRHRRATGLLVLGVVALVAGVAIPFASGAPDKKYTFTGNAAGCAGSTGIVFDVSVKNTTRTQNLGSVDLYAPSNIAVTNADWAPDNTGGGSTKVIRPLRTINTGISSDPNDPSGSPRTLIPVRSLQLGHNQTLKIRVTASVTGTGTRSWYSLAKQANDFNPGDLDLSNAFTMEPPAPTFQVTTCELRFAAQPPNPWQKGTTATVAAAVYAGSTLVPSSGLNPSLTAVGAGATSDFTGIGASSGTYNSSTSTWTWLAAPRTSAPSGLFNLVLSGTGYTPIKSDSNAALGNQEAPFRVTDTACVPTQTEACEATSNLSGPQAGVTLTGYPSPISIDFLAGDSTVPRCGEFGTWNRAYIEDSSGRRYFPGVELDFVWGQGMLQIVYRVRNSEWVQTNVSRGNSDIEFCAGARHGVETASNDYAPPNGDGVPFAGKYGDAEWYQEDELFWGVLGRVSNPNKVKDDPAVCASGTQDLPTGSGNANETWRTWTICIPSDWDWKNYG